MEHLLISHMGQSQLYKVVFLPDSLAALASLGMKGPFRMEVKGAVMFPLSRALQYFIVVLK